jgi:hypothetical protein
MLLFGNHLFLSHSEAFYRVLNMAIINVVFVANRLSNGSYHVACYRFDEAENMQEFHESLIKTTRRLPHE